MRKILFRTVLITSMFFTTNTVKAQLNDILSNVASKVQSATTNSDNGILSTIGSVISSKLIPTSMQIVGTWTYKEPAVMLTSDNILKSTAGTAMTKQIETKLQSYLDKVGITNGNVTMTFEKDNSFYVSKQGKKVATGTYDIEDKEIKLTFKGRKTPCNVTPQLDNGSLVIVMDVTKLKTFLEGIGSNVSQLSTLTSLLKSMDGMKVGMRMTKQ